VDIGDQFAAATGEEVELNRLSIELAFSFDNCGKFGNGIPVNHGVRAFNPSSTKFNFLKSAGSTI
jgi:hypothetical protein